MYKKRKPIPYREALQPHTKTKALGHRRSLEYYQYTDLEDTPEDRVFDVHDYYELPEDQDVWVWACRPAKMFSWRVRIDDTDFGDYESLQLALEAIPAIIKRLKMLKPKPVEKVRIVRGKFF